MSQMKRTISLLIALVLLITVIPLGNVTAVGEPTFEVSTVAGNKGDTVTVNINMLDNPGIATIRINLTYDSSALELLSTANGTAMGDAMYLGGPIANNPYVFTWTSLEDQKGSGLLATMTFKIKDSATIDHHDITLTYDPEDLTAGDAMNPDRVHFEVVNGGVTVECIHHAGNWEVQTPATCSQKGIEVQKCTECGAILDTREIAPLPHTFGDWQTKTEPTCTEAGINSRICSVCQYEETESIPALGHIFGEWITVVSPTCIDKGSEKRICSVCQFTETRDVEATGHIWESDYTVDKEPTCTENGSKSIHCSKCDAVKDSQVIPATGHQYSEWSTVKEATCTEDGIRTRICTVCGKEDIETIPAAHQFGEWVTINPPTCTEKGNEERVCSVCQFKETRDIDATGHAWEEDYTIDQEPTATEAGSKSIHCKNCDAVKDVTSIPALESPSDSGGTSETPNTPDNPNPETGESVPIIAFIGLCVSFSTLCFILAIRKRQHINAHK